MLHIRPGIPKMKPWILWRRLFNRCRWCCPSSSVLSHHIIIPPFRRSKWDTEYAPLLQKMSHFMQLD